MKDSNTSVLDKNARCKVIHKILCGLVIALALMDIAGIWKYSLHIMVPLLGVDSILSGIQDWDNKRNSAIFSFCVAGFIFVVWLIVLIICLLRA